MSNISLPMLAVWANVAALVLAGFVNLAGFRRVREIYADWDIPEAFYHSVGLLQFLAAAFLASPEMRVYGIVIAAPIMFGAVVMLLSHERYAQAAPVAAMMATLVLAILTVPMHSHAVQFAPPLAIQEPGPATATAVEPNSEISNIAARGSVHVE
jgi:hypothetical protein